MASSPGPSPSARSLAESEKVITQVLSEADEERKRALGDLKRARAKIEALTLQLRQKVPGARVRVFL